MLFFLLTTIKRRNRLDGKKFSTQVSNEFFSVNEQQRKAFAVTESKYLIRYALKATKNGNIPTYLVDEYRGEKGDILELEKQYIAI